MPWSDAFYWLQRGAKRAKLRPANSPFATSALFRGNQCLDPMHFIGRKEAQKAQMFRSVGKRVFPDLQLGGTEVDQQAMLDT
jgi:hypothetical protein